MRRAQAAIALIMDDPFDDAVHVVWVDRVDGATTITFGDTATAEKRLEAAAAIFGLSSAQHRLGKLIVSGKDMPEAAKEMEVSINTVRTHTCSECSKRHALTVRQRSSVSYSALKPQTFENEGLDRVLRYEP